MAGLKSSYKEAEVRENQREENVNASGVIMQSKRLLPVNSFAFQVVAEKATSSQYIFRFPSLHHVCMFLCPPLSFWMSVL